MINFVILGTERTQIQEVLPCLHKSAFVFSDVAHPQMSLYHELVPEDTEGCLLSRRQEKVVF